MILTNNNNFKDEISRGVCVVDFFAEWCGPCKMMSPILDSISSDSIKVIKVDIESFENLAEEYGVKSLPTISIFIDGEMKHTFVGATPKNIILNKINDILEE